MSDPKTRPARSGWLLAGCAGALAASLLGRTLPGRASIKPPTAAQTPYDRRVLSALPHYGFLPQVSLVDAHARPWSPRDLQGAPWLMCFIFTHCETVCPAMTQAFKRLEQSLHRPPTAWATAPAGTPSGTPARPKEGLAGAEQVRLVCVSTDPWRDTPEALQHYAETQDAHTLLFLTGEESQILAMMKAGGLLAPRTPHLTPRQHSSGTVLVDGRGEVRGIYYRRTPAEYDRILRDTQRLLREPEL